MFSPNSPMSTPALTAGFAHVLVVDGTLDDTSYLSLRDAVVGAALGEPLAVVVDVTDLDVPIASAWSALTSARWHVSVWPGVPVVLVCRHPDGRRTLARTGITRQLPVYPTLASAEAAVCGYRRVARRRARVRLPAVHSSLQLAREVVTTCLMAWSRADLVAAASLVADILVENVLEHTNCAPGLVIESRGQTVTIAVDDSCKRPAVRHETAFGRGDAVSGLAVLATLARTWGNAPTPTGKTVWAVIGPDNRI